MLGITYSATNQRLDVLSRAKSWYVDGTFKLCRHPFNQLLTVSAFVRADDHAKQVPLLFASPDAKRRPRARVLISTGISSLITRNACESNLTLSLFIYPLARRKAPTAGRRPVGEGANIDRRLVPYTRDAMRTKSRIEFIYLFIYLYICINRGPCARGIGILALVNSLKQKLI